MAMGYQQDIGAGQLRGGTVYPQNIAVQRPPATLISALSKLSELNARLGQLANRSVDLASTIGGPSPSQTGGLGLETNPAAPPPMVERLNDDISLALQRVSHIEQAIAAMSRSLGADQT